MARVERAYEGFTGMDREAIGQWIGQFKAALESQDRRVIADARKALTEALDRIEEAEPL